MGLLRKAKAQGQERKLVPCVLHRNCALHQLATEVIKTGNDKAVDCGSFKTQDISKGSREVKLDYKFSHLFIYKLISLE